MNRIVIILAIVFLLAAVLAAALGKNGGVSLSRPGSPLSPSREYGTPPYMFRQIDANTTLRLP